jgi:hypothetical protein
MLLAHAAAQLHSMQNKQQKADPKPNWKQHQQQNSCTAPATQQNKLALANRLLSFTNRQQQHYIYNLQHML